MASTQESTLAGHGNDTASEPYPRVSSPGGTSRCGGNGSSGNDAADIEAPDSLKNQPVTWLSLPNKGQLAIILLARLADPISERSLTSYVFYQLRWFNPTLPAADIAYQMGVLTSVFAAAQCVTAVMWGRAADALWIGRKGVLMIGLAGGCIAAMGVGFSRNFAVMLLFRALCGALNGNVGVLRTMVSEVTPEKRYQSRAFLLLPMMFNIGVIIGPIVGGFLAPATETLEDGTVVVFPSRNGWLAKNPYAFPNVVNAVFLSMAAICVVVGLDETHPLLRNRTDHGRRFGKFIWKGICFAWRRPQHNYSAVPAEEETELESEVGLRAPTSATRISSGPVTSSEKQSGQPFRALLTRNVILVLTQHFLQALHVSTYNTLLYLILSAPRAGRTAPLFSGGLGLSAYAIGMLTATIGFIGLPLQLILYPRISVRRSPLSSYKLFLPLSIVAYSLFPLLTLLDDPSTSLGLWPAITLVIAAQVLSRAFVNPATVILVNNSAPHASLLATLHGLAQSVSSAARTLGPIVGGTAFAWGLEHPGVGSGIAVPFWVISGLAVVNWIVLWWIKEED